MLHHFCQGFKTSEQTAGGEGFISALLQGPQSMPRLACTITKGLHHQEFPSPRISITKRLHPQGFPSPRVSITKRLHHQDVEHLGRRKGSCLPHTSQEAGSRKIKRSLGTRCSLQKNGFIARWISASDFPLCISLLHWPVLWIQ